MRARLAISGVALLAALSAAAPAVAAAPRVTAWHCLRSCYPGGKARGGSLLLVRGHGLAGVTSARFRGGAGRADDRLGRVGGARSTSIRIRLPGDARTGGFYVRRGSGPRSREEQMRIVAPPALLGWRCIRNCAEDAEARDGSLLVVRGRRLSGVRTARFEGGPDRADDRRGRVGRGRYHTIRVRVPWDALAGPARLAASGGWRSPTRPARLAALPSVAGWECVRSCAARRRVRPGSLVDVTGVRLERIQSGYFASGAAPSGQVRARVSHQSFRSLKVRVPTDAVGGAFGVMEESAVRSPARRIAIRPTAIFPVRGRHNYGSRAAAFGAARSGHRHQGQDVFARCGTWLRAARGGRVRYAGRQSAAGNYIVIAGNEPDYDYVYMHLRKRARYRTGQHVPGGALIGEVGETGNAHGCHLHFELWSAPGWYEGGHPFDPLPYLKGWDRYS